MDCPRRGVREGVPQLRKTITIHQGERERRQAVLKKDTYPREKIGAEGRGKGLCSERGIFESRKRRGVLGVFGLIYESSIGNRECSPKNKRFHLKAFSVRTILVHSVGGAVSSS